jgi:hypothetical protein
MRLFSYCRTAFLAVAILLPVSVFAHHGWSWTTGGNIQLTGVVVEARLGNPHGVLVIDVEGERWTAEVGQPWRNKRAGLRDGDLSPGAELKVEGEPSANIEDRLIKVERLWIGDTKYELYPNRS